MKVSINQSLEIGAGIPKPYNAINVSIYLRSYEAPLSDEEILKECINELERRLKAVTPSTPAPPHS